MCGIFDRDSPIQLDSCNALCLRGEKLGDFGRVPVMSGSLDAASVKNVRELLHVNVVHLFKVSVSFINLLHRC
jgi:hypothetical protein